MPTLPAASEALTVITFCPDASGIELTLHAVVPVQTPEPPRSSDQETAVTPTLSEAVPAILSWAFVVVYI